MAGKFLVSEWQIDKLSVKDSADVGYKIGFLSALYGAVNGIEGEITDINITIRRESIFNFRKLLSLKHMKDDLHTSRE